MAPSTTKPADAIDKRRPHMILQTLPSLVFNTPTNTVTVRFAMSTPSLKSDPPRSSFSDVSSARHSFQSSVSREPLGDGKVSPAISAVGTGIVSRAELEAAKDELRAEMKVNSDRLEGKLDALEARVNGQFDHLRETVIPQQVTSLNLRIDDVEKKMQENHDQIDARINDLQAHMQKEFQSVEARMRTMQDSMHQMQGNIQQMQGSIDLILRILGERQPDARMQVPTIHVQHSPDTPTGGAPPLISPDDASDLSLQLGVAGPSSPQALESRDAISLSPSDHREAESLFRGITRMATEGNALMNKLRNIGKNKKKDKGSSRPAQS